MRQFLLVSSLLSAVAALAMVAICVVMPKLEWILATVVLAAFACFGSPASGIYRFIANEV
jgi:hypothetical protein